MDYRQYLALVNARYALSGGYDKFQGAIKDADLIHNSECNQAMVELGRAMNRVFILFGLTDTDKDWLLEGKLPDGTIVPDGYGTTETGKLIPFTDE